MEAQYTIERGVPIPPRKRRPGGKWMHRGIGEALIAMQPGDSVFIPGDGDLRQQARLLDACAREQRFDGRTFTTRRVEGGVRIWRTA